MCPGTYSGKAKFLLERDGTFMLSEGRARLLRLVAEKGSLQAAAREMGMSYRHAWGIVRKMNASAGEDLVVSERGGRGSGHTSLTPAGVEVLEEWDRRMGFVQMAARYGPKPVLAVDAVLLRGDSLLLVRRANEPFRGSWVLPGGFMEQGETCEEAAARELREETGLRARAVRLVGVFSDPGRDPRHHTVSAAFLMEEEGTARGGPRGGDDAAQARFHPLASLPPLAFDHDLIIRGALRTAGVKDGRAKDRKDPR